MRNLLSVLFFKESQITLLRRSFAELSRSGFLTHFGEVTFVGYHNVQLLKWGVGGLHFVRVRLIKLRLNIIMLI